MSKKRIYEYAKEVNLKSKDIIDELKKMDVEVTSHMQTLEDDQIKALDKVYKPEQAKQSEKSQQQGQSQQKTTNNKPNKKDNTSNNQKQNNKNNKKNNKNNKNKLIML